MKVQNRYRSCSWHGVYSCRHKMNYSDLNGIFNAQYMKWNRARLEEVFTDANISISGRVFHSRFSDISESGSWERVRADVLHQIKPQPGRYSGLNSDPLYLFWSLLNSWPRYLFIQCRSAPIRVLTWMVFKIPERKGFIFV